MNIRVASHLSYLDYKEFFIFCLFRGRYFKVGRSLCYILSAFGSILSVYAWVEFGPDVLLAVFSVILLFSLVFLILCQTVIPKSKYRTYTELNNGETEFIFNEDGFTTSIINQDINEKSHCQYSLIIKVYETDRSFFLFIKGKLAFIVPKSTCTLTTVRELGDYLRTKVQPKSYIQCH